MTSEFAVDLGGFDAVANPVGVPLGGLPGLVATRGCTCSPSSTNNRLRVSLDWLLDWALPPQVVQLGFLREEQAMAAAERGAIYAEPPTDEWEAASMDLPTTRAVVADTGIPRPGEAGAAARADGRPSPADGILTGRDRSRPRPRARMPDPLGTTS